MHIRGITETGESAVLPLCRADASSSCSVYVHTYMHFTYVLCMYVCMYIHVWTTVRRGRWQSNVSICETQFSPVTLSYAIPQRARNLMPEDTSVHGLGLSVVRESRLGWKTMASASCLRLTNICLSPPNQNQMQLVSVQVDGGPKAMSWRVHLLRVVCSSAAGRRLDWIYHRPPGRTSPPKEQCLNSPTGG